LFGWGAERGYLAGNPASGIKDIRRPKGMPDANRPWADEERDAVLEAAPAHIKPAIALMMFTALGPRDALTLPRSFFRDGEIATRRAKTGEPVYWPCPAPLTAILAAAPAHDAITLCANSTGRPWTLSGFRASWRPVRRRLEMAGRVGPGLTLYGLRHTVAVILREIGCDERTIADALGQKTIEMARHYAKGADLRPKMRGVVRSFNAELEKRAKNKSVKPGG
jgi:integrase